MDQFSFKELYDCFLKFTYNLEAPDGTIEKYAGETLAHFDKIQIAGIDEFKSYTAARGGFDNRAHVLWETTKELNLIFTQGVFSKDQLALQSNSALFTIPENQGIVVSRMEKLESDSNGFVTLKNVPCDRVYVTDINTNKRITNLYVKDNKICIYTPYVDVLVDYQYLYKNGGTLLSVGQRYTSGWLSFEGKTRIKDDTTGQVVTGLIKIPKLKLMSDLSIKLGANASPNVVTFKGKGVPVGERNSSHVMEYYFLNDDIDSDF